MSTTTNSPNGVVAHERSACLDNAKAGLIILVVFTHLFSIQVARQQPAHSVYLLILLFHMPAFIFVTGMLSKPYEFTEEGARSLGKIVWLYLCFNVINYTWGYVFFDRPWRLDWVLFDPMFALWFLLAMVWWRVLLPFFALGKGAGAALASIVAAGLISAASGYVVKDGEWIAIARTLTFLPFYVAGYRAKQMGWSLPRTWWTRVAAFAVFGTVLAALLMGGLRVGPEVLLGRGPYRGLHLTGAPAGVIRLGLLLLGGVLVAAFLQLVPRRTSVLTVLGVTTLSVYAWHALVVRNIKFYEVTDIFAGTVAAVLLTTIALVVVFGYGPIPRLTSLMAGAPFKKKGV